MFPFPLQTLPHPPVHGATGPETSVPNRGTWEAVGTCRRLTEAPRPNLPRPASACVVAAGVGRTQRGSACEPLGGTVPGDPEEGCSLGGTAAGGTVAACIP